MDSKGIVLAGCDCEWNWERWRLKVKERLQNLRAGGNDREKRSAVDLLKDRVNMGVYLPNEAIFWVHVLCFHHIIHSKERSCGRRQTT
jgi:hypothetical protein